MEQVVAGWLLTFPWVEHELSEVLHTTLPFPVGGDEPPEALQPIGPLPALVPFGPVEQ
jgi:hypothetical protein